MHSVPDRRTALAWATVAACLILVTIATARTTAQLPPADSLEVQELVLVNANGDRRARLSLVQDHPVLQLFDTEGNLQLTLGLADDGPALLVKDKKGKVHNFLSLEPALRPTPATDQ